jgi:hypothetical protein
MRDPERSERAATGGAIVRVVLLAFAAVLAGGDTFAAAEHLERFLPAQRHLGASIAAGTLPEWWEQVGVGVPFAANPAHAALYPPAWLAAARCPIMLWHRVCRGQGGLVDDVYRPSGESDECHPPTMLHT